MLYIIGFMEIKIFGYSVLRVTKPEPEPAPPTQDQLILRGEHPFQKGENFGLPSYVNRSTMVEPESLRKQRLGGK